MADKLVVGIQLRTRYQKGGIEPNHALSDTDNVARFAYLVEKSGTMGENQQLCGSAFGPHHLILVADPEWTIARWSLVGQVPQPPPMRLFSFMNPLAVDIWLYILLAYVLVSLSMWVVARFTPYEWHDGAVCHCQLPASHPAAAAHSSNDFSLANSFWFTIGTLMQQGSDLNPKVHTACHPTTLSVSLSLSL